jgi:hypothetical protein
LLCKSSRNRFASARARDTGVAMIGYYGLPLLCQSVRS